MSSSPDFTPPYPSLRPSWEPPLWLLSGSCSGPGKGGPGVVRGCSLELAELSMTPEWRVFYHPTLNRTGSSRAGPLWTTHRKKVRTLWTGWTHVLAQAPSSIPAGREDCPLPRP